MGSLVSRQIRLINLAVRKKTLVRLIFPNCPWNGVRFCSGNRPTQSQIKSDHLPKQGGLPISITHPQVDSLMIPFYGSSGTRRSPAMRKARSGGGGALGVTVEAILVLKDLCFGCSGTRVSRPGITSSDWTVSFLLSPSPPVDTHRFGGSARRAAAPRAPRPQGERHPPRQVRDGSGVALGGWHGWAAPLIKRACASAQAQAQSGAFSLTVQRVRLA